MPHVRACGILAYQKKGQKMRINTAYKEGPKKDFQAARKIAQSDTSKSRDGRARVSGADE